MPIDVKSNVDNLELRVFFSKTVETIAAVQLIADPRHHEFAAQWANDIKKRLSHGSIEILKVLYNIEFQGLGLYEFVLQHRIFDDIEELYKLIIDYDDIEFIYSFFAGQLSRNEIMDVKENREDINDVLSGLSWFVRGNNESIECIIHNTEEFKRGYAELLMEIYKSDFGQKLEEYGHQYKLSVEAMSNKLMDMTPHELSQELMGKKFRLESDYSEYIFIPSYFISPHYIRIFNDVSSMLIFDMRKDAISRSKKAEEISNGLSVVSDKTRLEILRELIANTSYGKNLAAKLNLTTATISHHIEQLKSLNLIHEEKVKNIKYFSANADEIDKLLEEVKNYLYNK